MKFIAGQIIGFIAMGVMFASYQQKTQKRIMLLQIFAIGMFSVHFILIEAYTGALMNILGTFRAAIYYNRGKKWADSLIWVILFCISFFVVCAFSWEGWKSLLPLSAMLLSSVSMRLKKASMVRLFTFPCSPIWLTYNALSGSISGICTEILTMISIISAMIRLDFKKGKEENITLP